jgi:hypothetical protein
MEQGPDKLLAFVREIKNLFKKKKISLKKKSEKSSDKTRDSETL